MCNDLIRRSDILKVLNNERKHLIELGMIGTEHVLVPNVIRLVDDIKSVDAVEVVRCVDCMFSCKVDNREPMWECRHICRDGCTQWVGSDDFCSYGERRKE